MKNPSLVGPYALASKKPLFGRMTGQWRLLPLPFGTLNQFLPSWSPEELVATYAIASLPRLARSSATVA